jgi:hypothetical protein
MRVLIPIASTVIDQRAHAAFSPSCLLDLAEQLNSGRAYPVTHEHRFASICGKTVPGTARVDGRDLVVEAELSPPWMTGEELAAFIAHGVGGGIAGRILSESTLDTIHVSERVRLTEVALVALAASANPARPTKALT